MISLHPVFAWYDLWVGAYWDRKSRSLYLMIPFVGLRIDFTKLECRHYLAWELRCFGGQWIGPDNQCVYCCKLVEINRQTVADPATGKEVQVPNPPPPQSPTGRSLSNSQQPVRWYGINQRERKD